MDRRNRLAVVADAPVRIVLEDRQVVLRRQLDEASSTIGPERATGGILERGNRVEERDLAATLQLGFEHVEVESLVVHGDRYDLRSVPGEDLQRAVVRRPLDEHPPRPLSELCRRIEDEALEPAGRDEDPVRCDVVLGREHLAQRAVATACAVGEDRGAVTLERCARAVGNERLVEALGRRGAPGKGDRGHGCSLPGGAAQPG